MLGSAWWREQGRCTINPVTCWFPTHPARLRHASPRKPTKQGGTHLEGPPAQQVISHPEAPSALPSVERDKEV